MTNSRMKQRKLALICVGFIAILIGIAYLRIGTRIWNYDPFGECEYTTKGISMKTWVNFTLPEGNVFEDVKYLLTINDTSGSPQRLMNDYSCLQYYPNLIYLDLRNEEMSQELFDHIKSMVPENCEIVNYFVDLDNCETEKRKANWY